MSAPRRTILAGLAAMSLLATAACTAGGAEPAAPEQKPARAEVSGPRVVASYDGGVMVLDGDSLKLVADLPHPGFIRLNSAGDQRHALISNADDFQVLDTGVDVVGHGNHFHYYAGQPTVTDIRYPAPKPGHVVTHDGRVALFSDGAGTVQVRTTAEVSRGPQGGPTWTAPHPHHGVAVPLDQQRLVVSIGNDKERVGAAVVDPGGQQVSASNDCPALHGEAIAAGHRVVFGCGDGALVHDGDTFSKIKSPDSYGRIGTQAGTEKSPITLGDYKSNQNAEMERPTRVSLINAAEKSMRLVELGSSYSFRSLARGPKGEALVLTTDGNLVVIEPTTGEIGNRIKVIDPWQEPTKWQRERPTLAVSGEVALITDPAKQIVHQVHLGSGKVVDSVTLPHPPNEIVPLATDETRAHKDG